MTGNDNIPHSTSRPHAICLIPLHIIVCTSTHMLGKRPLQVADYQWRAKKRCSPMQKIGCMSKQPIPTY